MSEANKHSDAIVSNEVKRMLLNACGITDKNVVDVELDLSGDIATLKVTTLFPASVGGLLAEHLQAHELVKRPKGEGE